MQFIIAEANAADTNAPAATAAVTTPSDAPPAITPDKVLMDNLLILGMLFFIFYFILIRPQQKRLKAHQSMLKDLQKGNKVVTTGGLLGSIVKFEGDDIVQLEIAQGIKVRVARSAITDVVDEKTSGTSANDN